LLFNINGTQAGRQCYLNCTNTCFISCAGKDSVELDSIAPQDLAQGECGAGQACGEMAAAKTNEEDDVFSAAIQKEAQRMQGGKKEAVLSDADVKVLAALDGMAAKDEDLERQFKAVVGE